MAAAQRVGGVRVSSRLHLTTSFFPHSPSSSSARHGRRGGYAAGPPPPALTADVRVVIRRHFPVAGPRGTRIAEKVAADIALRRRPSRKLREPRSVGRALAEEVLPLLAHAFDRGAVAAATGEICARVAAACADPRIARGGARVAAACADPRIARGGARVLVLIDTFACPVVFRPQPRPRPPCNKPTWSGGGAVKNAAVRIHDEPCTGLEPENGLLPASKEEPGPIGVIGDGQRPEPVEERLVL